MKIQERSSCSFVLKLNSIASYKLLWPASTPHASPFFWQMSLLQSPSHVIKLPRYSNSLTFYIFRTAHVPLSLSRSTGKLYIVCKTFAILASTPNDFSVALIRICSSLLSKVGAHTCTAAIWVGWQLNLATRIRELTSLYPIKQHFARLLSRKPTPHWWCSSSPDQIKPCNSPFSSHFTSCTVNMSQSYASISRRSSISLLLSLILHDIQYAATLIRPVALVCPGVDQSSMHYDMVALWFMMLQ